MPEVHSAVLQLLTETLSCVPVPQAGSVVMLTTNTPRFPAPFFVVTEMTLEPLPSILDNDKPRTRLFPFPAWAALIVRTPVAFVIVNVAVPVLWAVSLWLSERVVGLIVPTHCGIGVAEGDGIGVGVAVGVGVALLPFPLFPLSPLFPPFPFPLFEGVGVGVAVGVAVGVGVGVALSDGEALGLAEGDGVGDDELWSTSSLTVLSVTSGIR
jgi:hypothetical protein